jgi:hypothetical protein
MFDGSFTVLPIAIMFDGSFTLLPIDKKYELG